MVILAEPAQGFSPQVLVIEEAGQVLEAHVLATFFPTIKHVIAIGDPLQLRPNVNCYGELLPYSRDLSVLLTPQNSRSTVPEGRKCFALMLA